MDLYFNFKSLYRLTDKAKALFRHGHQAQPDLHRQTHPRQLLRRHPARKRSGTSPKARQKATGRFFKPHEFLSGAAETLPNLTYAPKNAAKTSLAVLVAFGQVGH